MSRQSPKSLSPFRLQRLYLVLTDELTPYIDRLVHMPWRSKRFRPHFLPNLRLYTTTALHATLSPRLLTGSHASTAQAAIRDFKATTSTTDERHAIIVAPSLYQRTTCWIAAYFPTCAHRSRALSRDTSLLPILDNNGNHVRERYISAHPRPACPQGQ